MGHKKVENRFLAFIEVQVQSAWFELEIRTRHDFANQLKEIVKRYPGITVRWFDAEAWTGRFTDFILCEFEDLDSYNTLWGELRRHPFLSTPYAVLSKVILGLELNQAGLLSPATKPEGPSTQFCASCGKALKLTAKFCTGCGSPTEINSTPPTAAVNPAPNFEAEGPEPPQ